MVSEKIYLAIFKKLSKGAVLDFSGMFFISQLIEQMVRLKNRTPLSHITVPNRHEMQELIKTLEIQSFSEPKTVHYFITLPYRMKTFWLPL